MGQVDVRVVEHRRGVVPHCAPEVLGVCSGRHLEGLLLHADVVRQVDLDLHHDAQRPVASYDPGEDLPVGVPARVNHGAIGQHDGKRPDHEHERPEADVSPVYVHPHGAAHREVGVRLHDGDGEPVGIDRCLQVTPAHAGLHAGPLVRDVDLEHPVHRPHVEVQARRARGLATHAEAPTSDRHRTR